MFKSFTITTCMNKIKIRCMCNAAMSSLAQSIVSYIYIFNAKRFFTNRKPLNINAKYPDEFDAHISQSVDKSGFVSTRSRYLFHSLPQQDLCHLERRRKSLTLYSLFGRRKKKIGMEYLISNHVIPLDKKMKNIRTKSKWTR